MKLSLFCLIVISLCAANLYGQRGRHATPTRKARAGSRNTDAGTSEIRWVDFLNFTYRTSICTKDAGIGGEVTVQGGEFKQGSDADEAYFGVVDNRIIYGDLTGDGQEEAAVHTACGQIGWNYGLEEVFVYTMQGGRAALLAETNQDRMVADYQRYFPNGVLWSTRNNGLRIRNGAFLIDWYADGAHCCPEHIATLVYRLNGRGLALAGRPAKRPFRQ